MQSSKWAKLSKKKRRKDFFLLVNTYNVYNFKDNFSEILYKQVTSLDVFLFFVF